MATMSFKPKTNADQPVEESAPTQQIVPAETTLAVAQLPSDGDVQGEVTIQDIRLPRINLVQKVGDLSNSFPSGSYVLNKEYLLSDGKAPMEVTILRIRKQYQENLPFGDDAMPKTFDTIAEVREAGGQVHEYSDPNFYGEIAHIQMVVQAPDDASEEVIAAFPYTHNEKAYALAIWTVKSSGYTAAAKQIFTAKSFQLRDGLYLGKWQLGSEVRKNAKNTWLVPKLMFVGKHDEADAKFFQGLL